MLSFGESRFLIMFSLLMNALIIESNLGSQVTIMLIEIFVCTCCEGAVLGGMVHMDNSLYLLCVILCFGERRPTSFFSNSHGLRQGYLLSMLLFVIIMEALGKMISVVVSRGLLFGFSVEIENDGGIDISHLLFAGDTLIFCGAVPDHLCFLFFDK